MKVLAACCTLTSIGVGPYIDHTRLFYRLGKEYPKVEFHQFFVRRMSIDRFRNSAASMALTLGCDYIFFFDDDMQFDYTIFGQLLEGCKKYGYDILAALNYIRGYPFEPMAFKFVQDVEGKKGNKHLIPLTDEDIEEAIATESGIYRCGAIGTATCLIKVKTAVKYIQPPWFLTGPHNTEDIYFCLKSQTHNKKVKVGVHCRAITGHLLDPEVISYDTKKNLMKYHESYMSPDQIEKAKDYGDRGRGYIVDEVLPLIDEPTEVKTEEAQSDVKNT